MGKVVCLCLEMPNQQKKTSATRTRTILYQKRLSLFYLLSLINFPFYFSYLHNFFRLFRSKCINYTFKIASNVDRPLGSTAVQFQHGNCIRYGKWGSLADYWKNNRSLYRFSIVGVINYNWNPKNWNNFQKIRHFVFGSKSLTLIFHEIS